MTLPQLLRWQWQGYSNNHQHKTNLLLHIVAVPMFVAATILIILGAVKLAPVLLGSGVAGIVISLILQGRGHKLEQIAPEPFTGPANFIARFFFEQWITFPRFVLSGGWLRNLTRAGHPPAVKEMRDVNG